MRREWSGWIRGRQWSEFEKLAKTDPCQDLADTVAELELGFPEKPDRRALRKVLFLLSQAGFEPRELDLTDEPKQKMTLKVAFMVSPEANGDTVITYGREDKGRVGWLIAHFSRRDGITRAIEDTTTLDESHVRLMRMRNLNPTPSICAEIPVDYALARLAQAVAMTKNMPPVMAYWRSSLPLEDSPVHPAQALPRTRVSSEDLRNLVITLRPASPWRLELGSLAPALEEFLDAHGENATEDQLNDLEWWYEILAQQREQLFTPEVTEDHVTRLLDVAYLAHLKGDDQSALALQIADDLVERGPHSAYAQWIASKTLILLYGTLYGGRAKDRHEA